MSWILDESHLDDLARGAALLGTGGGGDPHVGRLLVREAIRKHGPITVLDIDDLQDDDLVIPVAQMGAPTVVTEKLPAGTEAITAFRNLEKHLGRRARATMPTECGGVNSMVPLQISASLGIPVVDADGMGRAFPELQMETFSVYGVPGSPLSLASESGESVIIDTGSDNLRMERFARAITVQLGGVAHIADYPMSGADVRRTAIRGTLTLAILVGRTIREARESNRDPIVALAEALSTTMYRHLVVLYRGKITDVARSTDGAFVRGSARATGLGTQSDLVIEFQNENLSAVIDGRVVALVPDLICVLEEDTAEPITTESLRYGQRVTVVGISTPEMMRTSEALAVFGPQAFGLDHEFRPVEELTRERSYSTVD